MFTARGIELGARAAFVAALIATFVLAVGPFQGLEHQLVPWDKAAHAIAFYALTALGFAGLPRLRRNDLAFGLMLLGLFVEVVQGLVGRDCDLYDAVADAVGVLAVYGPTHLEALRARMRTPKGAGRLERRRRSRPEPVSAPAPMRRRAAA